MLNVMTLNPFACSIAARRQIENRILKAVSVCADNMVFSFLLLSLSLSLSLPFSPFLCLYFTVHPLLSLSQSQAVIVLHKQLKIRKWILARVSKCLLIGACVCVFDVSSSFRRFFSLISYLKRDRSKERMAHASKDEADNKMHAMRYKKDNKCLITCYEQRAPLPFLW